jgi:hypothetical protein
MCFEGAPEVDVNRRRPYFGSTLLGGNCAVFVGRLGYRGLHRLQSGGKHAGVALERQWLDADRFSHATRWRLAELGERCLPFPGVGRRVHRYRYDTDPALER